MPNPSAFDVLIEQMQANPEDWFMDQYTLLQKSTGVEVWIANGWSFYKFYRPYSLPFTWRQKFVFSKILRQWQNARLIFRMEGHDA